MALQPLLHYNDMRNDFRVMKHETSLIFVDIRQLRVDLQNNEPLAGCLTSLQNQMFLPKTPNHRRDIAILSEASQLC
jgi:hypothetical protein